MEPGKVFAIRSGSAIPPDTCQRVLSIAEASRAGAEIAFICNPTALHIPSALECASHGLDLFIEKPIGHDLAGWFQLRRIVEKQERIAYVAYHMRFHPLLAHVRELLRQNVLGRVYSASAYCGSYLPDWHQERDYRSHYSSRLDLGGGVVLDLSHELDYLSWFFGAIDGVVSHITKLSCLEINTEDHADILLRFRSSVRAQVHLDYYRRPARRVLEVAGSEGTLQANLLTGHLRVHTREKIDEKVISVDPDQAYRSQLEYFRQCVMQRNQPMNNLAEAEALWFRLLEIRAATT